MNAPDDSAPRLPLNVPGPFFVTENCIDCDQCRSDVPAIFQREDDSGCTYVFRQPVGAEETAQARAAAVGCPVEAIQEEPAEG